jgi:hypothetical protein
MVSGRPATAWGKATVCAGPPDTTFFVSGPGFPSGARIQDMGNLIHKTPGDPTDPTETFQGGGRPALAAFYDGYRDRLRRMVEWRRDPRLRARLDASDVVQEALLDVARDLDAYLADPKLPPLLWLRLHVGRRLTTLHRQHPGTKMRDAGQEISPYQGAQPRPVPPRWQRCSWVGKPHRPRPLNAPSGCCGSRRR